MMSHEKNTHGGASGSSSGRPTWELKCLVVYIAEAHAKDEWPISSARYNKGQEVHVLQTHTTEARAIEAKKFFDAFGYTEIAEQKNEIWNLVVAQPEEELGDRFGFGFEGQYKPWPFRAFGFKNGFIDFIAEPRACEVDIHDISNWISDYIN